MGKKLKYDVDEYVFTNWVLPKIGKKTILNNRIKDLIKGNVKWNG